MQCMTKIPLFSFLLKSKSKRIPTMALAATPKHAVSLSSEPESDKFPVPLTPPYPALSKEVELRRALAASARSGAPLEVEFQDEWICVVNKPAGVYCEAILSSLELELESESESALESTTAKAKAKAKLHLANRLDRDTSGLMVVTKHNKAAARLVKSFTDHTISKTYLALSVGPTPKWRRARITSGHGRSKHGAWRVYSVDDVDRTLPGGSRVKRMETAFEVLSINGTGTGEFREPRNESDSEVKCMVVRDKMVASDEENEGGSSSRDDDDEVLMRAYPKSGRTHQIRLHCQYLGLPIRGDVKYGGVSHRNGIQCDFHALHAETLSFLHPITDVPLHFKAPPPPWLQAQGPLPLPLPTLWL